MSTAPIFVFSCERAGSTLLRFILDTHAEVAAPGEVTVGELTHRLLLILSRTQGQLSEPCAPPGAWWMEARQPDTPVTQSLLAEARATVESIMGRYVRACGKRRWCAKSPGDIVYRELLRQVWPEAGLICLYRNCLDVCRSCLDASHLGFMQELAPYVAARPTNLWEAMVMSWVEKTELLMRFEERWQAYRVRYEDLVRHPEPVVAGMLDHLNLGEDPHLVERIFTTPHHPGGGDPKIWSTNSIEVRPEYRRWPMSTPTRLFERVNELHQKLGYARIVVG